MSRFATFEDMVTRFGQSEMDRIADRDGDGVADQDTVSAAIEYATSEILGRTSAYRIDLSQVWPVLRDAATAIARERLYDNSVPESVSEQAESARQNLYDINTGALQLVDSTGKVASRGSASLIKNTNPAFNPSL